MQTPYAPTRVQLASFLGNNPRLIAAFEALFNKNGMIAPSYSEGQLLAVDAAGEIIGIDDVVTGNVLLSQGVGNTPAYGKVGLTTHVTGTLPTTNGGTGLSAYSGGDMVYASAVNVLSKLPIGGSNAWLKSNGSVPSWSSAGILSKTDDTNVTLTLGGSPSTALLTSASLTLGWTGQLATSRGGTGLSTYTQGDLVYASAANVLSKLAIGTSGKLLSSNGTIPDWSTATFPATAGGVGTFIRSDGTNWATSTLTLPNSAAANNILYATSTDAIGSSASFTYDGTNAKVGGSFLTGNQLATTGSGGYYSAASNTKVGYSELAVSSYNSGITTGYKGIYLGIGTGTAISEGFGEIGTFDTTTRVAALQFQRAGAGAGNTIVRFDGSFLVTRNNKAIQMTRTDTGLVSAVNLNTSNEMVIGAVYSNASTMNTVFAIDGASGNAIWRVASATELMRLTGGGALGIGLTPTAILHLKAGTTAASTAPLKFTSGPLLTTAEAGANEFLTDKYYGTITTGAARKEFTLNDAALTSGRVPYVTTNGRLTDAAGFTADASANVGVATLASTGTIEAGSASSGADGRVNAGLTGSDFWECLYVSNVLKTYTFWNNATTTLEVATNVAGGVFDFKPDTGGTTQFQVSSTGIKFGTHSAIAGETVTGYIPVKDLGGTTRKLAVVS